MSEQRVGIATPLVIAIFRSAIRWMIATHVEDMSPGELGRRAAAEVAGTAT
jgi:hypothetical protein